MFSLGMLAERAFSIARRNLKLLSSATPPPSRTEILIALESLVKVAPFLTSRVPFCLLICAHFECPLITKNISTKNAKRQSALQFDKAYGALIQSIRFI